MIGFVLSQQIFWCLQELSLWLLNGMVFSCKWIITGRERGKEVHYFIHHQQHRNASLACVGRFSVLKQVASVAHFVLMVLGKCLLVASPCNCYFSLQRWGASVVWKPHSIEDLKLLKGFSIRSMPWSQMCVWFGNPGAWCSLTAEGVGIDIANSCGTQCQVSKCGKGGEKTWCQVFKMTIISVLPWERTDFKPLFFDSFRT